MELGICMRDLPVEQVVRLGEFAEDHGYSSIYLPETGNRKPEGQSLIHISEPTRLGKISYADL